MKWMFAAAAAAALFVGAPEAHAQAQRRTAEPPKGTLEGGGKIKPANGRGVRVRTGPTVGAPGKRAASPELNARRALAELERTHRIRMAKLERLRRLAEKLGRTDQLRRIAAAKQKEMRIYEARKKAILQRAGAAAGAAKKGRGMNPARARAERREAAERREMQRRKAQQRREMEERRRRAAAEKARRGGGGR